MPCAGESEGKNPSGAGKPRASLCKWAKLAQGDPIVRDLCVGGTKPLETGVEVLSSADPQIACETCV